MNCKSRNFKREVMSVLALCVLCCMYFSCAKDTDEFSVSESNTNVLNHKLYYFGSDTDFEKLQDVNIMQQKIDMKHIATEKELSAIIEKENSSCILFVGNDVDIRKGVIDDLRNSGTIVTQINKSDGTVAPLPFDMDANGQLIPSKNNSTYVNNSRTNEVSLVSHLSVNGERKMLASLFEDMEQADMKQAVTKIFEWAERKNKDVENKNPSKSANKVLVFPLDFEIHWQWVGDYTINTQMYSAETPDYNIFSNAGRHEYPHASIFEHSYVANPYTGGGYPHTWVVDQIQNAQWPRTYAPQANDPDQTPFYTSLRKYSPLNSSNGTSDGSSGSQTYGFNVGAGIDNSGPSGGAGFDWSHTTDWSFPACQINTYHNLNTEVFQVVYDVDHTGSWAGNSVAAENYTIYANTPHPIFINDSSCTFFPMMYFINMVSQHGGDRSLHVSVEFFSSSGPTIRWWHYHRGYFVDQSDVTYYSQNL
ncbi:MAG: hypothetical protein AAF617_05310 [Bacteroidota bacterium]